MASGTRGIPSFAILLVLALAVTGEPLAAQSAPGRIAGRVLETQTGTGIPGVRLVVNGTAATTLSGIGGRFTIQDVPAGTVEVTAENLGYAARTVTGVVVPDGGVVRLDITLAPQALELEAISVTAAAERGSVERALDEQRTAAGITSAITAAQMARSPDGDAAAALRRVSGVTVQDGRFVFVRGLGERYTTTSLNGARVPSPEPERRVVPLDLFPTSLLRGITTSKTFTPDQPGDFAGASVNIETREFPAERQVTVSIAGGLTDGVTGRDVLRGPGSTGLFGGIGGRGLPHPVAAAPDLFDARPQQETNRLVGAFRNAWSPGHGDAPPNGSIGISVGGSDPVFGRMISYLGSFSWSRSTDMKMEQVRAHALPAGDGGTREVDRYRGTTGTASVLWGGLAQLSTLLGSTTRIVLDATYSRSIDDEARTEHGFSENLGTSLRVDRLRYVERDVLSTRLRGEHEAGRHRLEWVGAVSRVHRDEPDRSEIVYGEMVDPATGDARGFGWFAGSPEAAVRTFGELTEHAWEAGADYRFRLGDGPAPASIGVGTRFRATDRDAGSQVFSISAFGLTEADRMLPPEQIFDGRFAGPDDTHFRLTPLSQGGRYAAHDRLAAAYALLDVGLGERVRLVTGARIERDRVEIDGETTLREPFTKDATWIDVLPSASLTVALGETTNLRLSASRTLARPEYRELADVTYREVIDGDVVRGNSNLDRTRIWNADLRWEWYTAPGEVLSAALFAKHFDRPIERVFLATSGTRLVTYVNAESARSYGIELEARKRLGFIADPFETLTAFANATVMRSDIEIDAANASQTNPNRAMVGQAPWVLNAGLGWTSPEGTTSATVLFNTVGDRIVSAGIMPLPDVREEARHGLDLSLRVGLTGSVSAKFDAKNLLDSPHVITQGSVTRERYRTGRSYSFGLSWNR